MNVHVLNSDFLDCDKRKHKNAGGENSAIIIQTDRVIS